MTIGDLAATYPELLGVGGTRLHEYANGIDYSEVIEEYETKSIGREVTFEKDVDDPGDIFTALDDLARRHIES